MNIKEYFVSLFKGIYSLLKGMAVTGKELVTPKVTEQYPENRATLQIPERFRATLQFIYDDNGNHKCIGCRSCERNCPNGTIHIDTRMVDLPNGKKKMKLDKYTYDLGSCTFCGLCVQSCPTAAIEFSNDFEQAVFRRDTLVKQLNYLPEKDESAPITQAQAEKPNVEAKPEPIQEVKAEPINKPTKVEDIVTKDNNDVAKADIKNENQDN